MALGLGLVAVVFTFLNAVIFRVDEVRNPHELFAVERQRSANAEPEASRARSMTRSSARRAYSPMPSRSRTPTSTRIDGRRMEGSLVTGNFFHVLGVSAARGRTLTPSDDEPGGRQAIVLSHRAWSRQFASDPGVLGRTVLLNGVPFHVVGVMPEDFRGLDGRPPDFWAPLSLLGQFRRTMRTRRRRRRRHHRAAEAQVSRANRRSRSSRRGTRGRAESVERRARSERPAANLVLEPRQGTVPLSADVCCCSRRSSSPSASS